MMKKLIIAVLCVLLAALPLTGCKRTPGHSDRGPTEVDYGAVAYAVYSDGGALTFSYLDCFIGNTENKGSFVANTPDNKGALIYDFFDSMREYEGTQEYYKVPEMKFADVLALSAEEAEEYMKLAAGIIPGEGVVYKVTGFRFDKLGTHIRLSLEADASYENTGEELSISIVRYIASNERVYTVQAFAPSSCVEKYGPFFRDVTFDIDNALGSGAND